LRALVRVKKEKLRDAAGVDQYGVGRAQGAQLLQRRLEAQAELRPDATVIKVDLKAAFQNVSRSNAMQATLEANPEVAHVLKQWYQGKTTHVRRDANGKFTEVFSNKGFDQGCPLAAAAFSISQKSILQPFMQHLRGLDPLAKMYSYLDDTYIVVSKEYASLALAGLDQAVGAIGLQLNPPKTKVRPAAGRQAVQQALHSHFTPALPVVGAAMATRSEESDDALLHLGGEPDGLREVTKRLKDVWQTLARLQTAGLGRQRQRS